MRIAILGATSMLAADFVAYSLKQHAPYRFTLFARDPDRIETTLRHRDVKTFPECHVLDDFVGGEWDAIVNFVGVGDPARAVGMGTDILRITRDWDDRVLAYLHAHDNCRYIFLSSGAALGLSAAQPTISQTTACFSLNDIKSSDYYGIAKFYAETVHRANSHFSIIDVRVFNYISEFADLRHRFLINELISGITNKKTVSVSASEIWRDYLGTPDFFQLMSACLNAPFGYNAAIEAYSTGPISKSEILQILHEEFGLEYDIAGGGIDATGSKSNYYSGNRAAASLAYAPRFHSVDTLRTVIRQILSPE